MKSLPAHDENTYSQAHGKLIAHIVIHVYSPPPPAPPQPPPHPKSSTPVATPLPPCHVYSASCLRPRWHSGMKGKRRRAHRRIHHRLVVDRMVDGGPL